MGLFMSGSDWKPVPIRINCLFMCFFPSPSVSLNLEPRDYGGELYLFIFTFYFRLVPFFSTFHIAVSV